MVKYKTFCEFKFSKDGIENEVHINRRELKFNQNKTITRVERYGNSTSRNIEDWYYECDPHSHKMFVYPLKSYTSIVKAVGYLYKSDNNHLVLDRYDSNGKVYESIFYKQE